MKERLIAVQDEGAATSAVLSANVVATDIFFDLNLLHKPHAFDSYLAPIKVLAIRFGIYVKLFLLAKERVPKPMALPKAAWINKPSPNKNDSVIY